MNSGRIRLLSWPLDVWASDSSDEEVVPIVKNTFIAIPSSRTCKKERRRSVPSSVRLCFDWASAHSNDWNTASGVDEPDISTCASSDVEEDLEDSLRPAFTHQKTDELQEECNARSRGTTGSGLDESDISASPSICSQDEPAFTRQTMADLRERCQTCPLPNWLVNNSSLCTHQKADYPPTVISCQNFAAMPTAFGGMLPPPCQEAEVVGPGCRPPHQPFTHLSSEAWASNTREQLYKPHFEQIVTSLAKALQASGQTTNVDLVACTSGWSIAVQPVELGDWHTEHLLTVAKSALLDATNQSNRVFVMGHFAPQQFNIQPRSFTATLGVTESDDCHGQHPIWQVPVRVLIESHRLTPSPKVPRKMVADFKRDVADVTNRVAAELGACLSTAHVGVSADNAGWTIVVNTKDTEMLHKEYVLMLAQKALLDASQHEGNVCIIGSAANGFVPKVNGFVCMVGNMRDRSRTCWNLYSHGFCNKVNTCRRDHPGCLMPINVTVKHPEG